MHQQTKMTAAPRPPLSETQRKRRSLPTSEASDRMPRGASSGTRSPAVLDAVVPKIKAFGDIGEASEAWGKKSAKVRRSWCGRKPLSGTFLLFQSNSWGLGLGVGAPASGPNASSKGRAVRGKLTANQPSTLAQRRPEPRKFQAMPNQGTVGRA